MQEHCCTKPTRFETTRTPWRSKVNSSVMLQHGWISYSHNIGIGHTFDERREPFNPRAPNFYKRLPHCGWMLAWPAPAGRQRLAPK
jgi:hypothetical protein